MREILDKYKNKYLEDFSVWFTTFLLTFTFINIIMNHLPFNSGFLSILLLTGLITLVLYVLKPIRILVGVIFVATHVILMIPLAGNIPTLFGYSIKNTMPIIRYTEELLFKFNLNTLYGELSKSLYDSLRHNENIITQNLFIFFWVSITILIALIMTRYVEKRLPWTLILIPGIYFVIGWFVYVSDLEFNFSVYLIAILVYKQFLTYEKLPLENHKYYFGAIKSNVVTILVVVITSILLIQVMPIEKINTFIDDLTPSISGLRNDFPISVKVRSRLTTYGVGESFSFSSTMYSPRGELLGGPITDRRFDNLMELDTIEAGLYLRGGVKNVYDGSKWTSNFETFKLRSNSDSLPEDLDDYTVSTLTIYPNNIKTKTLYSPNMFVSSSVEDENIFQNEDGMLFMAKNIETDFLPYKVNYISDYVEILSIEEREFYLGIPKEGLTETIRIAKEATVKATSEHEKMQYLVNFLRFNYKYSLEPNAHNGSKDFVEQFLTEGQIGYCTYFATSLAVMGRSLGIPTRYVEGYLSDYVKNDNGNYNVTSDRAHAWVEAYIDGIGWTIFEATPSYFEPLGSLIVDIPRANIDGSGEDSALGELDATSDEGSENNDTEDDETLVTDGSIIDNTEDSFDYIYKEEKTLLEEYYVLILIGFVCILLIAYLIIKRRKNRTPREKILKMIVKIHKTSLKCRFEDNSDWPKAVIIEFLFKDLDMTLSDKEANIIDATLYAPQYDQTEDLVIMEKFYNSFLKNILKFKGVVKYIGLKIK